jgi:hypothetical protein
MLHNRCSENVDLFPQTPYAHDKVCGGKQFPAETIKNFIIIHNDNDLPRVHNAMEERFCEELPV